ncbi:unnamed protein product [Rotaria socialis]|uniref:Uncharacterized protein n=1 Tax=Rotaria socialis TaxID=392032 RepID=A0A818VY07_9BILA|nr:unnamed protein product [Rotaria socialis]CAF3330082.1 unnamed protein product [Rotaria socialis]CAF3423555.1 unnamed protein product [Rotaria socialis]CAF3580531.1 unnamed protein product [Rotaria socialis]CAF3717577.1 unnamed protein product [Rotaria socialis]
MSSSILPNGCRCSTPLTPSKAYQCCHCLTFYCYHCLTKHHHIDVKLEFMDLIKRIDEILAKFLHHAHNQTEWTDHLSEDRKLLQTYIEFIDTYYTHFAVPVLPDSQWVYHVKDLIDNRKYAIYEVCGKLLYPTVKNICN